MQGRVVIGIQARSTSKRFPGKVFALLGDKPVLQHVIQKAKEACIYLNKFSHATGWVASYHLLIPKGDSIKEVFKNVKCIEGPEDNVLARYKELLSIEDAKYFVRITGDCPLIPSYLISKHIKTAIKNNYDYCSNVDENYRVAVDGFDCEVISRRLLEWVTDNAKDQRDKEHVTTLIRRTPPSWAKIGHVIGFLNLRDIKLSVDTEADLERIKKHYLDIEKNIQQIEDKHGRGSAHRF